MVAEKGDEVARVAGIDGRRVGKELAYPDWQKICYKQLKVVENGGKLSLDGREI